MFKKLIAIVLTLVFLISSSAYANSENGIEELSSSITETRYTYISSTSALLTINSIGLASCAASINAYNTVDSVRISAYLEKYDDGWKTVKHWGEDYSGVYGSMANSWYVLKGYQYRWRVYYYAYPEGDSEGISRTVYYDF